MLPAGSRDATIPASALTADESYVVQVRAQGTAYETAPFLSSPIIYRALAAPAKVTIEHEAGTHRLSAVFEAVPGADRFIAQLIFAGGTAEERADAALRRFVFDDVRISAGAEIRLRPGSQTAGGAQTVWGEAIALSLHDIVPPGRAALACWDPAPADIGGASRVAVRVAWPQAPAGITSEHLVTANGIAITPEITMLGDGAERLTATAIAVTTMLGATLRHRRGHSFAIGPTTDLAIRPPPANLRASSAQGVITAYWDATDGAQYALEILDGDRAALPRDPLLVTGGSVVVPFDTADLGRYINLRVREVASSMFSAPLRIGVMLAPELADAVFDPAPPSVALALLAHAAHYGEAEFLTPDGKPLHRAPVVLVGGDGHVDLAELPEEVADAFAEELSVRCRAGRSDIWSDWSASVPIRFTAIAVPTELAPEMIGIGAIAIAWRSPLGARESIEIRAETGESLMDESEIGSIVRIDGHHKAATITGMRFAAQETAAVILAIHARRGELHSVSEPVTLQLESFAAPAITQADLGFTQQAPASPIARLSLAWRDVTGVSGHQAEILSGGTRILGVENLSGNPATIDATALFHIARNLVGGDLSVRLRGMLPGAPTPWSDSFALTMLSLPDVMEVAVARDGPDRLAVSWEPVLGATGYSLHALDELGQALVESLATPALRLADGRICATISSAYIADPMTTAVAIVVEAERLSLRASAPPAWICLADPLSPIIEDAIFGVAELDGTERYTVGVRYTPRRRVQSITIEIMSETALLGNFVGATEQTRYIEIDVTGGVFDLSPHEVAGNVGVRACARTLDRTSDWSALLPVTFAAFPRPSELSAELIAIGSVILQWMPVLGAASGDYVITVTDEQGVPIASDLELDLSRHDDGTWLARAMSMDFPGAFPAVFRLGAKRDGVVSATVMVRLALAE
jgi:hypothetical protein